MPSPPDDGNPISGGNGNPYAQSLSSKSLTAQAPSTGRLTGLGPCTFGQRAAPFFNRRGLLPGQTQFNKKAPAPKCGGLKNPGETYFHACSTIIGSESLTTVFEMGTGVAFPI